MTKIIKDAEGNDVEVLTQEDVDEQLKKQREEMEEQFQRKTSEEEQGKQEEGKQEDPETPKKNEETTKDDGEQMPEWAKQLSSQISEIKGNQSRNFLDDVTKDLSEEDKKNVESRYEKMRENYGSDKDSMEELANDAYTLAMGERPSTFESASMNGVSSGNGGKTQFNEENKKGYDSEEDKAAQEALGVTEDQIEKYGNK